MLFFVKTRAAPARVDQNPALKRGAVRLAALGPPRPAPVPALHEAPQLVVQRREAAEPAGRAHRRRELVVAHLAKHQRRDGVGERLEVEQRGQARGGGDGGAAPPRRRRRYRARVRRGLRGGGGRGGRGGSALGVARGFSRGRARLLGLSLARVDACLHRGFPRSLSGAGFRLVADLPRHLLRDLGIFLAYVARVARERLQALRQGHRRRALVRVRRITHAPAAGSGREGRGSEGQRVSREKRARTRASRRTRVRGSFGRRVARGRTHSFWWYRS